MPQQEDTRGSKDELSVDEVDAESSATMERFSSLVKNKSQTSTSARKNHPSSEQPLQGT
jgi:hypothetical protein